MGNKIYDVLSDWCVSDTWLMSVYSISNQISVYLYILGARFLCYPEANQISIMCAHFSSQRSIEQPE